MNPARILSEVSGRGIRARCPISINLVSEQLEHFTQLHGPFGASNSEALSDGTSASKEVSDGDSRDEDFKEYVACFENDAPVAMAATSDSPRGKRLLLRAKAGLAGER